MPNTLDALKSYSDDTLLKLGTQDGGAWFYIGSVGDYRKRWKEIDARVKLHNSSAIERMRKGLWNMAKNPPSLERYATGQLSHGLDGFSKENYDEAVKGWFKSMASRQREYDSLCGYYSRLQDFSERRIIEVRTADDVTTENCVNMLVEGRERGKFWDHSEGEFGSIKFYFLDATTDSSIVTEMPEADIRKIREQFSEESRYDIAPCQYDMAM